MCIRDRADAYQWWADHSVMLKNIHTDIHNNKIKMIKQQFNGKLRQTVLKYVKHEVYCSHYHQQAWIKEEENAALNTMQNALQFKCNNPIEYIKFISHFGPALTGMAIWNNHKTNKLVSELFTITDEAFIHLCIINYSATWKAQEKKKLGETDVQIPVSVI